MSVLNELRPGLDEKLSERALFLELKARGHLVEQQKAFPVFYREQSIGTLVPDLIVDGLVIADPRVVEAFSDSHVAQMLGYPGHVFKFASHSPCHSERSEESTCARPIACPFTWILRCAQNDQTV